MGVGSVGDDWAMNGHQRPADGLHLADGAAVVVGWWKAIELP